jgi:hypothetical protein
MRTPRICIRCHKPIKRGEDWCEAVGLRWHFACMEAANAASKETLDGSVKQSAVVGP